MLPVLWKLKIPTVFNQSVASFVYRIVNTVVADVHKGTFRGQLYVGYLVRHHFHCGILTDFSLSTNPWLKHPSLL